MAANTNDDERLIGHSYDGIQEYDNPLPRWWVYLFWATIVFSILYVLNLGAGIGVGDGRLAQYEADVAAWKAAHPAPQESSPEELAALAASTEVVARGRELFATHCVVCHRADGGGGIGPNLTDQAWVHGGELRDIHRTISEGVLAKGMPPWGKVLPADQVGALTAFVSTLRGTNAPGGKAPEGKPDGQ